MPKWMGQREYARHRAALGLPGTTHRAVAKAIAAGRIKTNSSGKIDAEQADLDWAANSSEGHRRNPEQDFGAVERKKPASRAKKPAAVKASADGEAPAPRSRRRVATDEPPEGLPDGAISLSEASAIEKRYKAEIARLEFEQRAGRLVDAAEVKSRWQGIVTLARNKILAVPSKAKARIPRLTLEEVQEIEAIVREALEELADGDD